MRSTTSLLLLLGFFIGLHAEEKAWIGQLDLGVEYDSNPQQYGDQTVGAPSNQDDTGLTGLFVLQKNWRWSDKWVGRHGLTVYEIRYSDNDDLNFRNINLQERVRTPITLFKLDGYFQGGLRINHFSLGDQAFLSGGELRPEIALMHSDRKGMTKLSFFLDYQSAHSRPYEDFEGDQFGADMTWMKRLSFKADPLLKMTIGGRSYQPENGVYAYDELSLKGRLTWRFNAPFPLSISPNFRLYDRSYRDISAASREDEAYSVGLNMGASLGSHLQLEIYGNFLEHDSNTAGEAYDKHRTGLSLGIRF